VAFFQLSVLGVFFDARKIPNLALAFAVSLALLCGFRKGFAWVAIIGFLLDIGSSWLWGTGALIFVIVGWLVDNFNKYAEIRSLKSVQVFALAAITTFSIVAFDVLGFIFSKLENNWFGKNIFFNLDFFSPEYGLRIIGTGAAGFLAYFIMRKLNVPTWLST
jgi:rod shape-determining protein MreD